MDAELHDVEEFLAQAPWLRRLAVQLADPSDADDLVQETWARLAVSPPKHADAPRAWLGQVLRNARKMQLRGRGRRTQREASTQEPEPERNVPKPEARAALPHPTLSLGQFEDATARTTRRTAIRRARLACLEASPPTTRGITTFTVAFEGEPDVGTVITEVEPVPGEQPEEEDAFTTCVRESLFLLSIPPPETGGTQTLRVFFDTDAETLMTGVEPPE